MLSVFGACAAYMCFLIYYSQKDYCVRLLFTKQVLDYQFYELLNCLAAIEALKHLPVNLVFRSCEHFHCFQARLHDLPGNSYRLNSLFVISQPQIAASYMQCKSNNCQA